MAFVYSCCFWFSLRLGGVLIGVFSLVQGVLTLSACCMAHTRVTEFQDELRNILNNMKLMYTKDYLEHVREDPERFITLGTCLACLYIALCLLYVYGAYTCNNMLMYGFILTELARLIVLSMLVATWLLVLKQNTMDIGLLIGASVSSGFFLLGMFYLWVCAANLPVLINEMERDEQAETIARLRRLLQENSKPYYGRNPDPYNDDIFTVNRKRLIESHWLPGSKGPTVSNYR